MALSFVRACYSKLSTSPTKLAEYLASGLPVVCNRGVGDVDNIVIEEKIGALLGGFETKDYLRAIEDIENLQAENDLSARCQETAKRRFDLLDVGGIKYRNLYRRMLKQNLITSEELTRFKIETPNL